MKSFYKLILLSLVAFAISVSAVAQETRMVVSIEGRGDIVIRLFTKEAPKTTAKIIGLVEKGFYNNQRFHRADRSPKPFLIQVGDPKSKEGDINSPEIGQNGSGQKINFEDSGISNEIGAVGLAHLPEDINSGDSQFYMLLSPARFLNGKYTVFGTVISGMEIVQKIQKGERITQVKIVKA